MTTDSASIEDLIAQIRPLLNTASDSVLESKLQALKDLLDSYQDTGLTEDSITTDINFALSKQSLTLEERKELLNTKTRQIEIATHRNIHTKNMLTVFIIINIVIVLIFVGLLILKVRRS